MPLPPLHSFTGYTIYRSSDKTGEQRTWTWALLAVVLANLPDIDFLPGAWVGETGRFHRGPTHSLAAAVICGLVAGLIARVWKKDSFKKSAWFAFMAYASHIVLDFFSEAHSQMVIFWPFSSARFSSPFYFHAMKEDSLKLTGGLGDFLRSMLSRGFFHMILNEFAIIFIFWFAASVIAEIRKAAGSRQKALDEMVTA